MTKRPSKIRLVEPHARTPRLPLKDGQLRDSDDELSAPAADIAHLAGDRPCGIPRQNEHVVRTPRPDLVQATGSGCASPAEVVLLVRITVNRKGDQVRARAAEVQQRVAFGEKGAP